MSSNNLITYSTYSKASNWDQFPISICVDGGGDGGDGDGDGFAARFAEQFFPTSVSERKSVLIDSTHCVHNFI